MSMEANVIEMPKPDEQTVFFGMPVEASSFTLEGAKGLYDGTFSYEQNIRGTWIGRVAGVEYKNGKRTWKIEVLEADVTA